MPPTPITRDIARRAVEAWIRRVVPQKVTEPGERSRPSAFEKDVERRFAGVRDALVEALAATGIDETLCDDKDRGIRTLAQGFESNLRTVRRRLTLLERTVARSNPVWSGYRRLIDGVRRLDDPMSPSVVELHHEVCLSLRFAGKKGLPWMRR